MQKRVRLVTVGAGVNHLWAFARMNNNGIRERAELASTPLDGGLIALAATGDEPHDAFWTDLFARLRLRPGGRGDGGDHRSVGGWCAIAHSEGGA